MQQAGAFCNFGVEAEFCSQDCRDICHLTRVLQQVLAIGRTVFHTTHHLDQLGIETVNTKVYASAFAYLHNLLVKLLAHLCHNLLDACRMDTAVGDQLMEREACHLATYGIKSGNKDSLWSIIYNYFNTDCSLQGTDITSFSADYTTLDLIVLNVENRNCVLNCNFRSCTLDGIDNYAFGLFACGESGLVHNIVDIRHRLGLGLGLHALYQLFLGIFCSHACHLFKFADGLFPHRIVLLFLLVEDFQLALEILLYLVILLELAIQIVLLLPYLALFLTDAILYLLYLGIFLVDCGLMLTLELEELLLGLEYLLFLYVFALKFCVADYLIPFLLKDYPFYENVQQDTCRGGQNGRYNICDHCIVIVCCIASSNNLQQAPPGIIYKKGR